MNPSKSFGLIIFALSVFFAGAVFPASASNVMWGESTRPIRVPTFSSP